MRIATSVIDGIPLESSAMIAPKTKAIITHRPCNTLIPSNHVCPNPRMIDVAPLAFGTSR